VSFCLSLSGPPAGNDAALYEWDGDEEELGDVMHGRFARGLAALAGGTQMEALARLEIRILDNQTAN